MKIAKSNERMGFLVSKWGNSLAVRLPAESAKRIGVGEGDTLIGEIAQDGRLTLTPEGRVIGRSEIRRMREFLARQKKTGPVVAGMRKSARY